MRPAFEQRALKFGRTNSLVGVLTEPVGRPAYSKPVVVFLNSGIIHRVGANRIYVRLSRALARKGASSLRFDLSGIGDSEFPADAAEMPLAELFRRDIDDALAHLETQGASRFVLAGLCSGADNALDAICRDERIVGALLMDPFAFHTVRYYLRYYGKRVLRPRAWWTLLSGGPPLLKATLRSFSGGAKAGDGSGSGIAASKPPSKEEMVRRLEGLVDRGAHLLYAFTAGIEQRYNYEKQFFHAFPDVDFKNRVQLEYFPNSDHMFSPEAAQNRLEALVVDWFNERWRDAPQLDAKAVASTTAAVGPAPPRSRESPAL
jgi:hypothetical protein